MNSDILVWQNSQDYNNTPYQTLVPRSMTSAILLMRTRNFKNRKRQNYEEAELSFFKKKEIGDFFLSQYFIKKPLNVS